MTDLTTIFVEIDDFCKDFGKQIKIGPKKERNREMSLTMSEVMTLSINFHFSGYRTFKDYYEKHVKIYLKNEFPMREKKPSLSAALLAKLISA